MLMTPQLTANFQPAFGGFGQDGIRHDLNRLYYNDFSRQGMVDPQAYGAPYYPGYNSMVPMSFAPSIGYQAAPYYGAPYPSYDPRYSYARPFDYARPYDYARTPEYARPYDYARAQEFGRPYDYARTQEWGRPYDYARALEFGRPYDNARFPEYGRQHDLPYGRPFDANQAFFRTGETMRPIDSLPTWGSDTCTVPWVNAAETPDAYLFVVELPGVDLKDVNLQINGATLMLNAFRRPTWSNGTVTVNYHFAEGQFGTLRRVLPLPTGVIPGQIQASFHNGLLTIVLPKTPNGANTIPQATSIVINSNVPTTM